MTHAILFYSSTDFTLIFTAGHPPPLKVQPFRHLEIVRRTDRLKPLRLHPFSFILGISVLLQRTPNDRSSLFRFVKCCFHLFHCWRTTLLLYFLRKLTHSAVVKKIILIKFIHRFDVKLTFNSLFEFVGFTFCHIHNIPNILTFSSLLVCYLVLFSLFFFFSPFRRPPRRGPGPARFGRGRAF